MAFQPECSANGPEYTGPSVKLKFEDEEVELTWLNTRLRTFSVGDGAFDHIELTYPNGEVTGIPLSFDGADEFKARLLEEKFPSINETTLDPVSAKWYFAVEYRYIDKEWDEFPERY